MGAELVVISAGVRGTPTTFGAREGLFSPTLCAPAAGDPTVTEMVSEAWSREKLAICYCVSCGCTFDPSLDGVWTGVVRGTHGRDHPFAEGGSMYACEAREYISFGLLVNSMNQSKKVCRAFFLCSFRFLGSNIAAASRKAPIRVQVR